MAHEVFNEHQIQDSKKRRLRSVEPQQAASSHDTQVDSPTEPENDDLPPFADDVTPPSPVKTVEETSDDEQDSDNANDTQIM